MSDRYLSHEWVHLVFCLMLDTIILKTYGLRCYCFSSEEPFLYSLSQNGIRWVQSNQDWADVRCSGGLYKAWFTHRLNINSTLTPRDSRWRLLCPDPLDRVWNTTFVSQGPWDCWKFHTVFQGFLPSFLDFYLHSLSFEKVREKWCQMLNFPQCLFSLGYRSFKSWSLCWSIGQWHKPNLLHGLKRKT